MTQRDEGLSELAAAYEGFESPADYPGPVALEAYREVLLQRTEQQSRFLAERVKHGAHALEVACGNGRLLIQLCRQQVILGGVGIDIARSRIDFANQWAADLGLGELVFAVRDLSDYQPSPSSFDAAFCITGAFAYFEPIERGLALSITRALRESLTPDGLICLELYPHASDRQLLEASGGSVRTWSELPNGDPWRFYLSELSLDSAGDILTHSKTFIHRTDRTIDEGRRERLQLYSDDGIGHLLREAGFDGVSAHEGWSDELYRGGETMVVVARRM